MSSYSLPIPLIALADLYLRDFNTFCRFITMSLDNEDIALSYEDIECSVLAFCLQQTNNHTAFIAQHPSKVAPLSTAVVDTPDRLLNKLFTEICPANSATSINFTPKEAVTVAALREILPLFKSSTTLKDNTLTIEDIEEASYHIKIFLAATHLANKFDYVTLSYNCYYPSLEKITSRVSPYRDLF